MRSPTTQHVSARRQSCVCGWKALAASDLRLCEMAVKQVHDQPLRGTQDDSLYRVVGAERTNKGREPHVRRPHTTNPITEKEGVHGPQRALARRPTASQRAARARAVCSAVGFGVQRLPRINASSAHARRPAARPRARSQARHRRRRARRPVARAPPHKKNGPATPQFVTLPRLQSDGPAGHDVVRPEHGADRAVRYLRSQDPATSWVGRRRVL